MRGEALREVPVGFFEADVSLSEFACVHLPHVRQVRHDVRHGLLGKVGDRQVSFCVLPPTTASIHESHGVDISHVTTL